MIVLVKVHLHHCTKICGPVLLTEDDIDSGKGITLTAGSRSIENFNNVKAPGCSGEPHLSLDVRIIGACHVVRKMSSVIGKESSTVVAIKGCKPGRELD